MTIDEFLSLLENVKPQGAGYIACCPAHDDRNPSLSIKEEVGKILAHCHAGCSIEKICDALNIEVCDLFEDSEKDNDRRLVATYNYTDENGNLVWQKLRYEPKGFTVRRPTDDGGWEYNLKGIAPMLYNLPGVVQSDTVYLVEGEKDVDNLKELGLVATTAPFGAGKWDDSFHKYFTGKTVYIIPDNDKAGREHAEKIRRQLTGVASTVKVLDLCMGYPLLKVKGDISDVILEIGTEQTKELLQQLIENTPEAIFGTGESTETSQEWKFSPFEDIDLPPFPLDCLPELLQQYVKTISDNLATPVEMAVMISLAMLAVCLQGKVFVQAKEDYIESTNLYVLIIADPGERKSALLKRMVAPFYTYEKRINRERGRQMNEEEARFFSKEKELKEAQESGDFEGMVVLQNELDELKQNQTHPLRLTSDDFTVEALTSLMAKNDGKMAVISSEGGMFDNITGRYSSKNNFETLLKAYTGDTIRVDRKSREAELIENPFLTILLMAQEVRLQGIMSNGNLRGQGLLGRFLYCQPDSPLGTRKYDTPSLNHAVIEQFNSLIIKLLDLQGECTLTLSDEAKTICKEFFDWLEPQLILELRDIRDWASKLHGTTIRIAGILHCLENGGTGGLIIGKHSMENACKLAIYFIEHAKKAFSLMGANEEVIKAKYVLVKLKALGISSMSRRDIYQRCRGGLFKKTDDIDETLNLLIEHGYIRPKQQEDNDKTGRKSSVIYELNPEYFTNIKL